MLCGLQHVKTIFLPDNNKRYLRRNGGGLGLITTDLSAVQVATCV